MGHVNNAIFMESGTGSRADYKFIEISKNNNNPSLVIFIESFSSSNTHKILTYAFFSKDQTQQNLYFLLRPYISGQTRAPITYTSHLTFLGNITNKITVSNPRRSRLHPPCTFCSVLVVCKDRDGATFFNTYPPCCIYP